MLRTLVLKRSLGLHSHFHHLLLRRCSSSAAPNSSADAETRKYAGYAALLLFCGGATYYTFPLPDDAKHKKAQIFRYAPLPEDLHTVSNWSGTHEVQTRNFLQPEPVGSGLSPNGIGLSRTGMVNLALMDGILDVDKQSKTVRVQAGIRVQQLVDGLKDHGLTLQNFASIREQQIGGIIQVGAHGTGARLPPIDEQVIAMKLVTPAKGTIEISKDKDPELFYLARCGLGGLGVVAEVTLQCVDRQELVEHTVVSTMNEIKKNHKKLLSENKHVKYLYIPYTDSVVVVRCNPVSKWKGPPKFKPQYTKDEAIQHVRDLYRESLKKYGAEGSRGKSAEDGEQNIDELSFTELRDKLIALDPLNKKHIISINKAEAEFWRKSEGYRVGWSDEILGFDCGGQQWVSEACFPAGKLANPSMKDLEYIEELKLLIEKEDIPAPAPIEQRWTASSRSSLSPASSPSGDDIFSWVGIIMYLPTMDGRQRKDITEEFFHYRHLTQAKLWDRYSAYEHWAKIEGGRIKFWEDEWIAVGGVLAAKYPRLYLISNQQNHTVQQMGVRKDLGWEWEFSWRRPLFDNEVGMAISFLNDVDSKQIHPQRDDAWVWEADSSGYYSAKSAYNMMRELLHEGAEDKDYAELWKVKAPSKVLVFAWRVLRDRLPTRANLHKRQVEVNVRRCLFCNRLEEDASHLFFHCSKITPLWWESMSWVKIVGPFPQIPRYHFLQFTNGLPQGVKVNRWKSWWLALTWTIWQQRNKILFSNATFNANKIMDDATFLLWSWLRNLEKDFGTSFNHWSSNLRLGFTC
ncbi:hypothetical protein JHK82_027613 [Glycine max]|nr:hypothetical protein JHK87_027502 [Glycine soja]KAG5003601.1 hypothetical protein JHK86_027740 [Glycine max]KAG5126778.1 hypothetical protein JHK82_027613 [Glycine max]KAG5151386.1 hypothetical protein JHK84_027858 [Glycine max]